MEITIQWVYKPTIYDARFKLILFVKEKKFIIWKVVTKEIL